MQHQLKKSPAIIPLYLKALLKRRRRDYSPGDSLPTLTLSQAPRIVNRRHLQAYRKVSQMMLSDELPILYPQIMTFPLQMALLTDPQMPFPVMGLIHLANKVEMLRPITADSEPLRLSCSVGEQQTTAQGICFDVITQAHNSQGELLWHGTATMLYRCRTEIDPASRSRQHRPKPTSNGSRWQLAANTGRRYARVSLDLNPIHLFSLSARLFGFKQPIAHGMCMASRCIAALEQQLPAPPYRFTTEFKQPVKLPSTVVFHHQHSDHPEQGESYSIELWNQHYDALHLIASINKTSLPNLSRGTAL